MDRPLISTSSRPCISPLLTVPRAPITIGNTVTFMFLRFFDSLPSSRHLSFCSLSFNSTKWSVETAKSRIQRVLFFFFSFFSLLLGLVVWLILGDLFVFQNPRAIYASHFLGEILVCVYTISSNRQI